MLFEITELTPGLLTGRQGDRAQGSDRLRESPPSGRGGQSAAEGGHRRADRQPPGT